MDNVDDQPPAPSCDSLGERTRHALDRAVERLRQGLLVAFPTETVYGLGADALREDAIARVYAIKGRPSNNPLIVHVLGIEMARGLVREWTPEADRLARAFWPGPLTIVLDRSPRVPLGATAGTDTVALRAPRHPLALALLECFAGPIVAPSANLSGHVSPTRAEHVREAFDEDDVLVLDGGPCEGGIESTVISLVPPTPTILRPGIIARAEIERALGREVRGPAPVNATGPLPAPGMLARHYAPRAPARLVDASAREHAPVDAVVLALTPGWAPAREIPMDREASAYARRLYAALREADAMRPREILIERPGVNPPGDEALWDAIRDRLARCTTPAAPETT